MNSFRTIKELVIETYLAEGAMPSYEKLTTLVREHFPASKWQQTHYAWYKSKINRGGIRIPGLSAEAAANLGTVRNPPGTTRTSRSRERRDWPTWEQPEAEDILAMAHLAMPFVRFLNPEIIRAIVEDNQLHRAEWTEILQANSIDASAYLWERSPCAFPGIRRHAGSREIASYRGHTQLDTYRPLNALTLDDNSYPKQIWSFIFRGRELAKFGPGGYALAHLADHKEHGNRYEREFEIAEPAGIRPLLFGLYTCPTNTVYIPSSLLKPTDFVGTMRALLLRRAQQLYGSLCQMLPPFLRIPEEASPEWSVSEFKWTEPVGTTEYVSRFLEFRRERMQKLIDAV